MCGANRVIGLNSMMVECVEWGVVCDLVEFHGGGGVWSKGEVEWNDLLEGMPQWF